MNFFRKINTAIQLQKYLAEIPGISNKLKSIVTPNDEFINGVNLHRTVKSFEWWIKKTE
jgi:hypothetical protein